MRLSFVILNYNTRGLLRQCLKHIRLARISVPHEIIVLDNASADGSVLMVRQEFPEVKLLPQDKNLGYAAANNIGLTQATGDYILLLNADVLILDNGVEEMIVYMDAHPDIAILGPKLLNPDRSFQPSCFRYYEWYTPILRRTPLGGTGFGKLALAEILMKDKNLSEVQEVEWILGGACLVRRSLLPAIGLFDTRYFLYFEDMDWCRSARAAGYQVVYYPLVSMIHFYGRGSALWPWWLGPLNKLSRIHIASAIKYFTKWRTLEPKAKNKELGIISNEKLTLDS